VPSRLDPVPLEPVGEGGGVTEAKQFGGSRLVSGGGVYGALQVVSRNPVDEAIEINALLYVLGKYSVNPSPREKSTGHRRKNRVQRAPWKAPLIAALPLDGINCRHA